MVQAANVFTVTFGGSLGGSLPLITATTTGTATVTVAPTGAGSVIVPATANLRISGTGILDTGAVESLGGTNTWNGNVTLAQDPGFSPPTIPASDISINSLSTSPGDSFTINGAISQNVSPLTITGITGNDVFPIVVTTTSTNGLTNGETVTIAGVDPVNSNGNANGTWIIGDLTGTTFELLYPSGANSTGDANPATGNITAATNATPIQIKTASTAALVTGDLVSISNVLGNTAANGIFFIQVNSATTFLLYSDAAFTNPAVGNAAFTASPGAAWTLIGGTITGSLGLSYNISDPVNPGLLILNPTGGSNTYTGADLR